MNLCNSYGSFPLYITLSIIFFSISHVRKYLKRKKNALAYNKIFSVKIGFSHDLMMAPKDVPKACFFSISLPHVVFILRLLVAYWQ